MVCACVSFLSFFHSLLRCGLVFLAINYFRTFVFVFISRVRCVSLPGAQHSSIFSPWIFNVCIRSVYPYEKTAKQTTRQRRRRHHRHTINTTIYFRNLCAFLSEFRRLQHFLFPIQHQKELKCEVLLLLFRRCAYAGAWKFDPLRIKSKKNTYGNIYTDIHTNENTKKSKTTKPSRLCDNEMDGMP